MGKKQPNAIKVGVQNGKVVMDFGMSITYATLPPQAAADLARLLLNNAVKAAAVSGKVLNIGAPMGLNN